MLPELLELKAVMVMAGIPAGRMAAAVPSTGGRVAGGRERGGGQRNDGNGCKEGGARGGHGVAG